MDPKLIAVFVIINCILMKDNFAYLFLNHLLGSVGGYKPSTVYLIPFLTPKFTYFQGLTICLKYTYI